MLLPRGLQSTQQKCRFLFVSSRSRSRNQGELVHTKFVTYLARRANTGFADST